MAAITSELVRLEGGSFLMGAEDPDGFPADREGPVREVYLEPFAIAPRAVTNEEYASFARWTGHVSRAESRNTPDSTTGHMGFRVAGA
jgi:formylglycine-generating enzyme